MKENYDEEIRKLYELIDSLKNSDLAEVKKEIEDIKEAADEKNSQWERKHNIVLSKIEELKKNIQNLREDVEFYQNMNSQNSEQKGNNVTIEEGKSNVEIDNKELERLKKSLNNKIHDQRLYLLGLIRDLERKLSPKGSVEQEVVGIWDRISEMNLFLNKKADADDIKKTMAYL